MQVGFITNLRKIVEAGESRALLISATGTGKTYASAFAMRELGFNRVLFLVHRSTLAKQALASFFGMFLKIRSQWELLVQAILTMMQIISLLWWNASQRG